MTLQFSVLQVRENAICIILIGTGLKILKPAAQNLCLEYLVKLERKNGSLNPHPGAQMLMISKKILENATYGMKLTVGTGMHICLVQKEMLQGSVLKTEPESASTMMRKIHGVPKGKFAARIQF